ncbi:hypothetical protein OD91_1689 [Lutibacter sp. Hel_I_33_5]|uniref:hypothetical protein n=1 Tax=Lutibacter sp. Hel_I_33_5 TaxID=1566289 RepID=UPI00119CB43E|nr:hypothetical protein [Lutibacter sp. Hel_I_33_5]TVZ56404.1 hypothetical protein OD91_1689 [Lutibacter sp. Hel_I_33_5]
MKDNKKQSEGELFIADYLRSENIRFEIEKKIVNLSEDTKSFRSADFYLSDYDVYIEFYGRWNHSKAERERYREKKNIYSINKVPCVYLYPENLGIIDYCFSKRFVEVLVKKNKKKELFKYRLKRLILDRGSLFFWIFLSFIILFFGNINYKESQSLIILLIGVILFQLYRFFIGYKRFFLSTEYYR